MGKGVYRAALLAGGGHPGHPPQDGGWWAENGDLGRPRVVGFWWSLHGRVLGRKFPERGGLYKFTLCSHWGPTAFCSQRACAVTQAPTPRYLIDGESEPRRA